MALAQQAVEHALAGVSERGVAEVVAERDGLGQIFVQPEGPGRTSRDLRDLDRMGQPRPEVVPLVRDEDLRLVLQAPEGAGMDDAVPVARVLGPDVPFHRPRGPPRPRRAGALRGEDREPLLLEPLETLPGELRRRGRHRHPSAGPPARSQERASPTR